ncbi:MAG TPA: hypothetical protein VG797_02500, partial [Phycisphaerales bacterium]|nr:hypothetical protein [Phycisphaerales bacterium]
MASRGTQTNSLGLAAPIGVLAAILLAGAIFVAPMPFLIPAPIQLPEPAKPKQTTDQKPFVPDSPPWAELATALTDLREPPPATTAETQPTGSEVAQATHAPQLNWRYVGYIEEPHGLVAVVSQADSRQRIVAEGDVVQDPSAPSAEVTIVQVHPDKLTVRQQGKEMDFKLEVGEA